MPIIRGMYLISVQFSKMLSESCKKKMSKFNQNLSQVPGEIMVCSIVKNLHFVQVGAIFFTKKRIEN